MDVLNQNKDMRKELTSLNCTAELYGKEEFF